MGKLSTAITCQQLPQKTPISIFGKILNIPLHNARIHNFDIDTALKMKFFAKRFFNKCGQIRRKLHVWSHLLNKSLRGNFFFCAVVN